MLLELHLPYRMNTPLPTVARSNSIRRTTASVVPAHDHNTADMRQGNHMLPRSTGQPFTEANNGRRIPQYQTLTHANGHANGNTIYESTDGARRRASMDHFRNNCLSPGRMEVRFPVFIYRFSVCRRRQSDRTTKHPRVYTTTIEILITLFVVISKLT